MATLPVVVAGVVASWHAMFLIIGLWRRVGHCSKHDFRSCWCFFGGSSSTPPEESGDGDQGRLNARLAEIRVAAYSEFAVIWMHMGGAYGLAILFRFVREAPLVTDGPGTILFGISYITAFVLHQFPGLLHERSLPVAHMWCMGLALAYGANLAFNVPSLFVHMHTQVLLVRVTMSIAYPVAWINFFWNAAWVALTTYCFLSEDAARPDIPVNNVILNEIMVAVFLSYVLWKFELLQVCQVCSDLQAKSYLQAKRTMERLLADMCDAVVELDHNLVIRHACPKLANLLFRHTGITSLRGQQFANLLGHDDDRGRLSDFIERRAVPIEHEHDFNHDRPGSSSMYLDMVDANGTPVSVQLFHSCHQGPSDDVCHIVGVREVERNARLGGAEDAVGEVGQIGVHVSPRDEADSVSAASADGAVYVSRRSGSGTESDVYASSAASGHGLISVPFRRVPLIPEQNMDAPTSVIFNPGTYEIIATTACFQSLTGPLVFKANLINLVPNFGDFSYWVQEEVTGFFIGERPTKFPFKVTASVARQQGRFEFHTDSFIIDVRKAFRLAQVGVELFDDEEEHDIVCILVLGVPEPVWRRKTKKANSLMGAIESVPQPRMLGAAL